MVNYLKNLIEIEFAIFDKTLQYFMFLKIDYILF